MAEIENLVPEGMGEGAIAMHELYMSFVQAGFNEDQAFQLVRDVVSASMGAAK